MRANFRFLVIAIIAVIIQGAFGVQSSCAQPDSLWSRTYGSGGHDACASVIQTADGGFALAGRTNSFGAGAYDFWLVRTNENGDSLWSRTYGGQRDDVCNSLIQTADGGFALAGYTQSFGAGGYNFWLVRTNENGDSLWSRTYGGRGYRNICCSLIQTADGGFALAGSTDSFGAGGADFWLVRTNENGDSLWSHTYGRQSYELCNSLIQTADGGFALAGRTDSFGAGSKDLWLVRTNENGDSLWSRTYSGQRDDVCNSLIQTADAGFALAGFTYSFGAGSKDLWLVRTDENGDSLWSRTYGGQRDDVCILLIQTADGGFALAGYTQSFGAGWNDFWLVRTDENGDSLWSRTYGGESEEWLSSFVLTADGCYALAGHTTSFGAGQSDSWLVKLGPENSVTDNKEALPLHFGLDSVYPNPFNSMTRLNFSLPITSLTRLTVYDLSGRKVSHLIDGTFPAGANSVTFNAQGLLTGMYLIHLESGNLTSARKVLLVK